MRRALTVGFALVVGTLIGCANDPEGARLAAFDAYTEASEETTTLYCECQTDIPYLECAEALDSSLNEDFNACLRDISAGWSGAEGHYECLADAASGYADCMRPLDCDERNGEKGAACATVYLGRINEGCPVRPYEIDVELFECAGLEAPDPFDCGSGERISSFYRCDSYDQCADGSDEDDCQDFLCDGGETSVPATSVCDGFEDCADGADELNC